MGTHIHVARAHEATDALWVLAVRGFVRQELGAYGLVFGGAWDPLPLLPVRTAQFNI